MSATNKCLLPLGFVLSLSDELWLSAEDIVVGSLSPPDLVCNPEDSCEKCSISCRRASNAANGSYVISFYLPFQSDRILYNYSCAQKYGDLLVSFISSQVFSHAHMSSEFMLRSYNSHAVAGARVAPEVVLQICPADWVCQAGAVAVAGAVVVEVAAMEVAEAEVEAEVHIFPTCFSFFGVVQIRQDLVGG